MDIELVMAEFGSTRQGAGDAALPAARLEPAYSTFLRHFPEARVTVYSDQPLAVPERATLVRAEPPFDKRHGRYGWRANDWAQIAGLRASTADLAISLDADMVVFDGRARAIIPLVERFGLCIPMNSRQTVKRDAASTCDGGKIEDPSLGLGLCLCGAVAAANPKHELAQTLLTAYCAEITRRPVRGPVAWWRAIWATGRFPYALPQAWCVCARDIELPDPILLHVGHKQVAEKFAGKY